MKKRAIIYVRVSTDEQTKNYSITTQIDACKQYVAERGYSLLAVFSEDYSGATIDRPELNQAREFVAAENVQVVVVYDVDRLARKSVYQALIEEDFLRVGAVIEFVIGQYENTDEGRLQKQIRASIAEYEKAKILERSKRGKKGKAQSGFVLVGSRPPYGYKVVTEPHKAWLEIDEEEAEVVRMVFKLYIKDGFTIGGIASHLTDLQIPTRGDKARHVAKKREFGVWTGGMVRHILSNETYIGIWHYGKTKMVDDGKQRPIISKRGIGKQVARERHEWIEVQVPAIVTEEAFNAVLKRLELNKEQALRNARHEYLLGRRLTCSKCGYSYVGRTRRTHSYYVCNGKQQIPVSLCDMPNFKGDLVDSVVWEWLSSIIKNPSAIRQSLMESQEATKQANKRLFERLAVIEKKIAETEQQIAKLLDLYLSADFPRELLVERKARLEELLANLRKEHGDVHSHIEDVSLTDEQMAEIEEFCLSIREEVEIATFEDKRHIFDLVDLRGKLAVEEEGKVVYVKCKLGQQRVSVVATSHFVSIGATATTPCAFLSMAPFP